MRRDPKYKILDVNKDMQNQHWWKCQEAVAESKHSCKLINSESDVQL